MRRGLVLVAVLAALLFLWRLGAGTLWDQDEAKYAHIAREVARRGELYTLYANGAPWFVHPPLVMWLQAATGALLGFSEWTARIWSALAGVAAVVTTAHLGAHLYGPPAGVAAGVVLATTLEVFALARLGLLDMPLLAWLLLALAAGVRATEGPRRARRRAYRWMFFFAGLATLTKGPVGVLLPVMVLGLWWVVRGEWRERWREVPPDALLLYGLVGSSWYAVETVRHGTAFLQSAVGYYLITRFVGVVENQPGPWYYYVPVLLIGAFPWSAFLLPALRWLWVNRREAAAALLLVWIAAPLLFFSLAGTKLPNYILPVFPALAIAVGRLWAGAVTAGGLERRLLGWGFAALVPIMLALTLLVLLFGRLKYPTELTLTAPAIRGVLALLAASGLLAALLHRMVGPRASGPVLALATAAVLLGTVTWVVPQAEALKFAQPAAAVVHARLRPQTRVVGADVSVWASLVYYTDRQVEWTWDARATRQAVCAPGPVLVVTKPSVYRAWGEPLADVARPVWRHGEAMVLEKRRACTEGGS